MRNTPRFLIRLRENNSSLSRDNLNQSENAVKDARNICLTLIVIFLFFFQAALYEHLNNKYTSLITYYDYIESLITILKEEREDLLYGQIFSPSQNPYPYKRNLELANLLFDYKIEDVDFFDVNPRIVYRGIGGCDARVFKFNKYNTKRKDKLLLKEYFLGKIFKENTVTGMYLVHFSNFCDPNYMRGVKMIMLLFKCIEDNNKIKYLSLNIFRDQKNGRYKVMNVLRHHKGSLYRASISLIDNSNPYGRYHSSLLDDLMLPIKQEKNFSRHNHYTTNVESSIAFFKNNFLKSTRTMFGDVFASNQYRLAAKKYLKSLSTSKAKILGFTLSSFDLLLVGPFFYLWLTISLLHRVRRIETNKTENIWVVIHRKGILENLISIIILLLLLVSPISLFYYYININHSGEFAFYWAPFYLLSQLLIIRVVFWEIRVLRA